jgi:hypothetical protein
MARRLTQIDADADDTKEEVFHLRASTRSAGKGLFFFCG